ncbi:MAG: DUF3793 family protein [Clostridia bacterium]|nr:DUF3793 family protein [Clostridia bacterium]
MSELNIINNCSPTLAGLKTGNIFNYEIQHGEDVYNSVANFNNVFKPKGLKMEVLRIKGNVALIYLYRTSALCEDLSSNQAREFLLENNYPIGSVSSCLDKLKERINASQEFPHEIGLFIGYPIEDVKGFIEKGANGSKYCGAWRVYGDVDAAKKKFAIYKKCRDVYCSIYKKNNNFGKLIISK